MFWLDRPDYPGLPEFLSQDKVGMESLDISPDLRSYDPRQSLSEIIEQDAEDLWTDDGDVFSRKRKGMQSFRDPQQQQQSAKSRSDLPRNVPIKSN